jgi:Rha family phage regulatory protein
MTKTNITALNLICVSGDQITTDSRTLAKKFGKRHASVLRAFDMLNCSVDFCQRNFASAEILDAQGKPRRAITMTKDGFSILAMGFTGKEAMEFKEDYIAAFNGMAEKLNGRDKNLWQQMQALISKEVESKVRASFGSHLMLIRKKEIPPLRNERNLLEMAIQPSLLN